MSHGPCPLCGSSQGSAKTYSMPPFVVFEGRSRIAFANPSAAPESRASSPPATIAPDQPPTPDSTATYLLPWTLYVIGGPTSPDPVVNCHSAFPSRASTALNQPSMVP